MDYLVRGMFGVRLYALVIQICVLINCLTPCARLAFMMVGYDEGMVKMEFFLSFCAEMDKFPLITCEIFSPPRGMRLIRIRVFARIDLFGYT